MNHSIDSALEINFNSILLQHFNALENHLENLKKPKKTDIHNFRLWVKKLRSLLEIAESITGGEFKSKSIYKLIRPLYRTAGKIRENHISIGLLKKLDLENKYALILQKEIKTENQLHVKQLKSKVKDFHFQYFRRSVQKLIIKLDADLPDNLHAVIDRLAKQYQQQIHSYLNDLHSDEILHNLRKSIKQYLYFLDLLYQFNPKNGTPSNTEYRKTLAAVETKIGKRNDYCALINTIETHKIKKYKKQKLNLELQIQEQLLLALNTIQNQLLELHKA